MTYTELYDELKLVRVREKQIASKLKSLVTLKDEYLSRLNNGVTDYSRDILQKSRDPDKALIEVIDNINRDTETLIETINELRNKNLKYKRLIVSKKDIGGEVMRLYFIEAMAMQEVAARLSYSEKHAWKMCHKAINELLEVINDEENDL